MKKITTIIATLTAFFTGAFAQTTLIVGTSVAPEGITINKSESYTKIDVVANKTPTLTVENGATITLTATSDAVLTGGNTVKLTVVGDEGSKIYVAQAGNVLQINQKETKLFIDFESNAPLQVNSTAHLFVGNNFTVNAPEAKTADNPNYFQIHGKLDIGAYDSNNVYHKGDFSINVPSNNAGINFGVSSKLFASTINVNKDSTFTATAFDLVHESDLSIGSTVNVEGTMTATYWSGSSSTPASMRIGTLNILSGGKVENQYTQGVYIRNLSSAGEFITAKNSRLYVANPNGNTLITLNEGSNIKTDGATSQAESLIWLTNREIINGGKTTVSSAQKGAVEAKVVLNASQELGGFRVASGSNIEIQLNGNSFELGSVEDLDGNLSFAIVVKDFANNLFSFASDSKIVSEGNLSTIFEAYATIDGVKTFLDDLEWKTIGDRSYLYSQMAVPEPAEWAAIFGALALAFVAYKRRRS